MGRRAAWPWAGEIDGSDVVINLAGRSVNCRYNKTNLTEMMRSDTELLLKSRRVVPGLLSAAGFEFQFPAWPEAARNLVRQARG